ncbi:MAG TPA: hypothetical protein VFA98_13055 [Thermoanaerobaculia bacterium]|jgi:hypothetical protein|nr:hypothetical protein [Thermoanaerobaculia bacterium]
MIEASEICPRLWVGSFPKTGWALADAGFDTLVLCACDHQPPTQLFPGVEVARIDLIDDGSPITLEHLQEAMHLAVALAHRVRAGSNVLCTCRHGRNRSALVASLALAALTGCGGRRASEIVRERRRSPYGPALTNSGFVRALSMIPGRKPRTAKTARDALVAFAPRGPADALRAKAAAAGV